MTAWIRITRSALLIAAICLGGLSLGACNKGDEGEDRGASAKQRNKERHTQPIPDKPVGEGE